MDFDFDGMGVSEKRTLESGDVFVVVTKRNPRHCANVEVGIEQIPQLIIRLIAIVARIASPVVTDVGKFGSCVDDNNIGVSGITAVV